MTLNYYFKIILRTFISFFCCEGRTETLVLDFWWYLPWISKLGYIFVCLHSSFPTCHGFLRFTQSYNICGTPRKKAVVGPEPLFYVFQVLLPTFYRYAVSCNTALLRIWATLLLRSALRSPLPTPQYPSPANTCTSRVRASPSTRI